ncbi:pilus assembly protein PilM, partial [Jatrophihabitans endophyticus]|uniref:pilus assembly protein PilM n=1 Tax=Jatrophihabitans endophyticus TaxID=1206085 RepID=UPI0019DE8C68
LETVQAVERAGLHVEKVDLSCFAVLRAVATHCTGAEAIVDIGATGTLLVIHHDGTPQVVRTIPRGGDEITRLLSTRLGVGLDEAETLKTTLDADGVGADFRRDANDVITDAVRPLLSEIRSSLNFYVNSAADRTVERVTLVGRGSLLPGLADQLQGATGLTVRAGDPLQYVGSGRHRARRDDLVQFRSAAAVSVGLSLGAAS